MSDSTRRRITFVGMLVVIVLFLWQCTSAFDRGEPPDDINVFGPWLGNDADSFAAVLDDFTDRTGITVNYTGSSDFASDLQQRVTRGIEMPDLAVAPQPGLILELLNRDLLLELSEETIDAVVDNYSLTREQVAPGGTSFLMPYRANVKSLVWYRPEVFEEYGWEIPATLDELEVLVQEIGGTGGHEDVDVDVDDREGLYPWCFAIEAGTGTGWAASDWIEDILLRRAGPDTYDEWLLGQLPFTDDAVRNAVVEFDRFVLAPGLTLGGAQRILGETVQDASGPLFGDDPGCALYKQANFATGWFPDDVEIGPDGDVDFFVLPGAEDDTPAPLLRGGDGLLRFDDRDEVARLMTFLATPDGAQAWIDRGGYLSNRDTIDAEDYAPQDQPFAALLQEDRVERFDASDSFQSVVRDAWLGSLSAFIAESGRFNDLEAVDEFLAAVDEVRQNAFEFTVPDEADDE